MENKNGKEALTPGKKEKSVDNLKTDPLQEKTMPNKSPEQPVAANGEQAAAGQKSDKSIKIKNRLREYRIEKMMSKAELARKANLSVLTVARIEKGYDCRMDTKRKILNALGLKLSERRKIFEDD